VAPDIEEFAIRVAPVIIPERTARRLSAGGISLSGDPADLLEAVQSGDLFSPGAAASAEVYARVTLDLEARASAAAVSDSVEALGFRAFSFAEQFEEIQQFFVYYYLGLGVLGFIALVTASLGIVNTMVMSITERRREIGILKSLGADEREIRLAFLTESAAIGAVGSAIGIVVGWIGTRIVSFAMKVFMDRQGMPVFEPFALPLWLIALSLAFGVLVSLLAGTYPAGRAARVDPVEALRGE
jgi:putative ABC transport system permease protein